MTRSIIALGMSALVLGSAVSGCAVQSRSVMPAVANGGDAQAVKAAAKAAKRAQRALAKQDAAAAVGFAEEAVRLRPRDAGYRLVLAQSYLKTGRFVAARAAFGEIARGIAAAHGCTADVSIDAGYPVTFCDPRATAMMRDVAGTLSGERGWSQMPAPMMGGEDFSYVLRDIPGAMAFVGVAAVGSDPRTNPPLHNTRMTIDEDVMATGIAMHCTLAERFLERGFD